LNRRTILTTLFVFGLGVLLPWTGGCRSAGGPYAPQHESTRNPLEAQRLTLRAAELIDHDAAKPDPAKLAQAEKLLCEALTADLYHGPAHNDLGVVYLKGGRLYDAASEFEWARKLMPGHPDPRMNLAITLERAGRIDDALKAYASALEVYPGHIPTLEAITRLQLRHSRADESTPEHLKTIALEGDSPRWREWAQSQLTQQGGSH
jgi:tetratricopeptide (TPR) repeat protein